MRPLHLEFCGLRSYTKPAEVNFSTGGLLAIIGNTGAGKSSILEAMCLALYSSPTWTEKGNQILRTDGAPTMWVKFRFEANGDIWLVERSFPATSTPAAHSLKREGSNESYEKVGDIKAKIIELVGLDYDGFLQAVLLPQGRFDTLLKSPDSVRTPLFEAILGVDDIEAVKDRADTVLGRLRPATADIKDERSSYLPDPAGTAAAAATRLTDGQATAKALSAIEAAHDEAAAAAADAERAHTTFARVAARLTTLDATGLAGRARTVAGRAAELDAARAPLAAALDDCDQQLAAAAGVLHAAEDAGIGPVDLAAAAATLDALGRELEGITGDEGRNAAEAERLAQAGDNLGPLAAAAETAATELDTATTARDDAETLLSDARQRHTDATAVLRAARSDAQEVATATGALTSAQAKVTAAETAAGDAKKALDAATAAASDAADALQVLQRTNLAAAAAARCAPGEPCPVCATTLPDDFDEHRPRAGDLDTATAEVAHTEGERTKAESVYARAAATVETAVAAVGDATTHLGTALGKAATSAAAARELVGDVDPTGDETVALAGLTEAVTTAAGVFDAAKGRYEAAVREAARTTTELTSATDAHRSGTAAHTEAVARAQARRDQLETTAGELPAALAIDGPVTATSLTAAGEVHAAAVTAAEALTDAHNTAAKARGEASEALDAHDRLVAGEVGAALPGIERDAATAAERLGVAAGALGETFDVHLDGTGPAAVAAWVGALEAAAGRITAAAATAVETGAGKVTATAAAATGILAAAGLADAAALRQASVAAAGEVLAAQAAYDEASAQIDPAARLDAAAALIAGPLRTLEVLSATLGKNRFRHWVVERRQVALLATASATLKKMSGDQFRFTDNFEIFDDRTGVARDPRTLSGGETFLASLALALTLTEMAGRSGRRQRSLFLDEGFAALDRDSLDQAMAVLEGLSADGRLVVVITHLKAVADSITDVLKVTKSPTGGSDIHPLTEAERRQLLEDDFASGLIA